MNFREKYLYGIFLIIAILFASFSCNPKKTISPPPPPNTYTNLNEIPAVQELNVEESTKAKLDTLYKLEAPKQKKVLTDIIREIIKTSDIDSGTMKDRIIEQIITKPNQKRVLSNIYERLKKDSLKKIRLGEGINTITIMKRMKDYLDINESDIKRIRFYLISGKNLAVIGEKGEIYTSQIENGAVVVTFITNPDSLNFILKCSNGWVEQKTDIIDSLKLIGELENDSKELQEIYFGFNDSTFSLTNDEKEQYEKELKLLEEDPCSSIEILGYTDVTGSDDYNMELSMKRAKRVKNYLKNLGVNDKQITYRGLGKKKASGKPEKDRRVELSMNFWEIK